MWRVFWVTALVIGVAAVAVAAMSSTTDGALAADVPSSVRIAVFVLGGMLVVTAIVGNIALTAIEPRVRLDEGL